jgi:MOSC domain-containing protein YiiM
MVTREINAEIPQDRSILRHIVRDLNQNLGVYARIIQPGTIAINDSLSFR